jgi:hypothetical protein
MRAKLLNVVAAISLPFASLLVFGFVGHYELSAQHVSTARFFPLRALTIGVDRGRIRILWTKRTTLALLSVRPPTGFSFHQYVGVWPLRAPDNKRSVWEFDAHPLVTAVSYRFIVACPIWCVMVPFLIGPTLWIRRWLRKRPMPQGFAVERVSPRGSLN